MAAESARRFAFEYRAVVRDFPDSARTARIWIPLPETNETQTIRSLAIDAPVPYRRTEEKLYGNELLFLELSAPFPEEVPITVSADVERREVKACGQLLAGGEARDRLLRGDQLAPLTEEVQMRAAQAVARAGAAPEAKARALYDRVLADVDYDKSGEGWGRGDVAYVCQAGKGNCSDFHSLFIAMARSQKIPALFEIGFPLPRDAREGTVGGYHCWAWFRTDGTWRPVDISEADKDPSRTEYFFGTLCENRVAFTRGRDLILEPPQQSGPVNFLIYPYVEIDGKPDQATVEKSFSFRDTGAPGAIAGSRAPAGPMASR